VAEQLGLGDRDLVGVAVLMNGLTRIAISSWVRSEIHTLQPAAKAA
jgi:hypothetical protein